MSTPVTTVALLISETERKQQHKQIVAQSYLLLKDQAKMGEFLDDLIGWMGGNRDAELKTKHRFAIGINQYTALEIEFSRIEGDPRIVSADNKRAAKQAFLTQQIYENFRQAVSAYIASKQATDQYKLNASPPLKEKASQLEVKFSELLGKLPTTGDPLAIVQTLDSDPELKAFLTQRVERAGAGEPNTTDPTQDPTVTLGNKFYREYQDRKGSGHPNPFLDELGRKAEAAGMIRGTKDPASGNWSGTMDPSRKNMSFVELRENYKPTGQPHVKAVNLVVAREIGFTTDEVIALINNGAAKMSSGKPNPCIIKFTDGKTDYRLLAKEEFGKIIPYKIKEADFAAWQAGTPPMNMIDPRVTYMSGDDCRCKIVGNPARTAANDFAEMFVALADLNLKNVHTNIKAPTATSPSLGVPASGVTVTPPASSSTASTSLTSSISKKFP